MTNNQNELMVSTISTIALTDKITQHNKHFVKRKHFFSKTNLNY